MRVRKLAKQHAAASRANARFEAVGRACDEFSAWCEDMRAEIARAYAVPSRMILTSFGKV